MSDRNLGRYGYIGTPFGTGETVHGNPRNSGNRGCQNMSGKNSAAIFCLFLLIVVDNYQSYCGFKKYGRNALIRLLTLPFYP